MKRIISLAIKSAVNALPKAARTSWWLLKIILPVSLAVTILQYIGLIDLAAVYLTPLFSLIGLPGESAIVFITSIFLSLYAPIAIIATLDLGMREITILALMCLITHNMIVETAIQKKTGSSYLRMFLLRLTSSFVAAAMLNWLLPRDLGGSLVQEAIVQHSSFTDMLLNWFLGALGLSLKIVLIITGLMMLQNILRDFRLLHYLSNTFAPLMRFFGLPERISFLWLVAQTLGLAYGAAVLIEEVDNNEVSREDANLLNHHIAVNHSMLEDTLLFVAIGVPVLWIMVPRIMLAFIIVWTLRILQHTFTKNG
ncbi:MAG: nucleoside recognition protein [Paludibacter sp.]|jgi:hypothetical protein|nr:nucleoside recognition protein [Paludibacter sp.]